MGNSAGGKHTHSHAKYRHWRIGVSIGNSQ